MTITEAEKWIKEVTAAMPGFLQNMRDSQVPGHYRYSFSGDLPANSKWGLGNTVYAVKCAYMLNRKDLLDAGSIIEFINSFQKKDGEISDQFILKKSKLRRFASAFRSGDFNNINGRLTRRAETRQAYAALIALEDKHKHEYTKIPYTTDEIIQYIENLNWGKPWGAASHINHLVFFLRYTSPKLNDNQRRELITFVLNYTSKYRNSDGSWGVETTNSPPYQKINGAMKMLIAYNIAGITDIGKEKELIDLALQASDTSHACNNLNIICVLYYCTTLHCEYRRNEVEDYCLKLLEEYRRFYFPQIGGFSFLQGQANRSYYGAIITKGLNEPDIHGTHLFLWGITMIAEILKINDKFNLRLPVT